MLLVLKSMWLLRGRDTERRLGMFGSCGGENKEYLGVHMKCSNWWRIRGGCSEGTTPPAVVLPSLCGISTQDCWLPEVLARDSLAILQIRQIRRELWKDRVWIHQRKLMVINTLSLMQGHVPPSFCIDAGSCLGHGEMDEPLIRFSRRCHRRF